MYGRIISCAFVTRARKPLCTLPAPRQPLTRTYTGQYYKCIYRNGGVRTTKCFRLFKNIYVPFVYRRWLTFETSERYITRRTTTATRAIRHNIFSWFRRVLGRDNEVPGTRDGVYARGDLWREQSIEKRWKPREGKKLPKLIYILIII